MIHKMSHCWPCVIHWIITNNKFTVAKPHGLFSDSQNNEKNPSFFHSVKEENLIDAKMCLPTP